jgi:hypothetical protein
VQDPEEVAVQEAPDHTCSLEKSENTAETGQAETGGVTGGVVLGGGRTQTVVQGSTQTKSLGRAEPRTREPMEARQELQRWVLKGAVAFEGDAHNVPPKGALPTRPRTHTQATAFQGLRGGHSREGGREPWREGGRWEGDRKCDHVSLCGGHVVRDGHVVRQESTIGLKEPFGKRTMMATLTEMPGMPTGPPIVQRDLQRDLLPGLTLGLNKRLEHTGTAQGLGGSLPLGEAERRKDTHTHIHTHTHNSFGAAAHVRGEDGEEEMAGVLRIRGGDGEGQGGTQLNARDTHAMVNAALQVLHGAQAQQTCPRTQSHSHKHAQARASTHKHAQARTSTHKHARTILHKRTRPRTHSRMLVLARTDMYVRVPFIKRDLVSYRKQTTVKRDLISHVYGRV